MSPQDSPPRPQPSINRRNVMKAVVSASAMLPLSGCLVRDKKTGAEGWLPRHYDAPGNWPPQVRGRVPIDPANPSIVRADRNCVLCGQCIEVCRRVQTIFGTYKLPVRDDFICVHCGQCALWCPTAAISEADDIARVKQSLKDPSKVVIVQTAPATRVGIGEEFGLAAGSWAEGKQVAALRRLGFRKVFDTNFAADLTILEESSELIRRLQGASEGPLPQFTSCCPGWVKFVEYYHPELIPHLSTAKSPQQMFGALAKTYYAKKTGMDPASIFSVAIMPCTAKKFEAARPEVNSAAHYWGKNSMRDVDAVLTVRELAWMMKEAGLDPASFPEEDYDSVLGEGSGAGLLFGSTGGVMEAAVRTAFHALTGHKAPASAFELTPVRGLKGVKEASLDIPGHGTLQVAVAHGLRNARTVIERIKAGRCGYRFIEVMACPGGCIGGGGMPRSAVPPADDVRAKRIRSLQAGDAAKSLRESHENREIQELYRTFLERPLSPLAHELLHTRYVSRSKHLDIDPSAIAELMPDGTTETEHA